ncbi:RHS repeat-associated core domain-containing protein [Chryseobacterium sp. Leaf405]|uniref:RHS repeat-associated core domain-containing protein n=1 Tax=Chryseobacterium sp. Leaf405 TaxID=1736367 RepID=UPI000B03E113|nr:RHS repeat-associated core domain-containing protein [Chryseobacterium sp. Leaf405]
MSYFKNANGSAEVLQENNYYPFGLKHEGYNPTQGNLSYQYKYNGVELQQESGMYAMDWRHYMPELGRWNGMDQLSEKYYSTSPYAYVLNNVINRFDPDGRLSQAQTDYVWNNSGQGVTSWSFNNDGSPKMDSYNYMSDSDSQSLINSFYGVASSGNSATISYFTGTASQTSYMLGGNMYGEGNMGSMHTTRVSNEMSLGADWYGLGGGS